MSVTTAVPGRAPRSRGSVAVTGALVVAAGVLVGALFTALGSDRPEMLGWDFRTVYFVAGEAVVDGRSPYPADPADPALDPERVYAYPPQLAFLVAPVTALPIDVAAVVAVLASLAALLGALALVGVRDVRCYAVVILWAPGWNALEMANVSALLALLLALVWRFRDRLWPMAAALGALVSVKLFLWPVLVWAIATRRTRAAALAVALGAALTAVTWAVIGFAGLGSYPELLDRISSHESYSITGAARELGLGAAVAYGLAFVLVALLIAACVRFARAGDESRALFVAVLAALAVSPVVWLHYLVLLIVPLGLVRPRFSPVWLLPVALWIVPRAGNGDGLEVLAVVVVVAALSIAVLARPEKPLAESAA